MSLMSAPWLRAGDGDTQGQWVTEGVHQMLPAGTWGERGGHYGVRDGVPQPLLMAMGQGQVGDTHLKGSCDWEVGCNLKVRGWEG